MLNFRLVPGAGCLKFASNVLSLFEENVQRGYGRNETVGQLYARELTTTDIVIEHATVLPPVSASPTGVRFSTYQAFDERAKLFEIGLHCVGLWHTHPVSTPKPSMKDELLAANYARAAAKDLPGVVFVILGTKPFPRGIGVWFHDQKSLRQLTLEASR